MTNLAWTIGEVQTGLVQNSTPAGAALIEELLQFQAGSAVVQSTRPQRHATSAELLTGVDCAVPTAGRGKVRGVGTVASRGSITGGRLAQATAWTTLAPATANRRLPWSHYLAARGVLECIGAVDHGDIAAAYLSAEPVAGNLNLTAISVLAHDRLLLGPTDPSTRSLDRRPPLRPGRTSLRFAIGDAAGVALSIDDRAMTRRLTVPAAGAPLAALVELCEEVARHDWLLTTVTTEVNGVEPLPLTDPRTLRRLTAVLDALGHLWFPAARLPPQLRELWCAIDEHLGMSRQWQAMTSRVRDRLLLASVGGSLSGE